MRRMRTGLLFAVAVTLAFASPLAAQMAPTLSGETGLFELSNAQTLPVGRFSFALFYSHSDRTAAPSLVTPPGTDDPLRYGLGKLGFTAGFGALPTLELTLSAGEDFYHANDRDWSGVINGHERQGRIRHSEADKIRIGAKWLVNPKTEPVKLVLLGGVLIPTQSKSDPAALSTYRADWDFGFSLNYSLVTAQMVYTNYADYKTPSPTPGTPEPGFDVPNTIRWGLGVDVPIIPETLRGIGEVSRTHYENGDSRPNDFTEVLMGLRAGLGHTGFVGSGAIRFNIDRWVKYGSSPNNIGFLVQLAYSPLPPAPPPVARVAVPESAPEPSPAAAEPVPQPPSAAPAPITEPAPAPRAPTSTTDEVLFDQGKSRLTNIAKAILDGVAPRMKNNLSATCTITGYTDPKERGGDHTALARARAEAAKDYLVKRHGIDASRIKVDVKGDADAGPDSTRNRRAAVTVTFP